MHVSNLFTPCIIKDRIGWQRSCYQLTKTIKTLENQPTIHFRFHKKGKKKTQKYEKRHHLTGWNVCKWCAMSHRMIPTVHLYWMMHTLSNYKHDTYTVLLELKYWAGDNQSSSKNYYSFDHNCYHKNLWANEETTRKWNTFWMKRWRHTKQNWKWCMIYI